jgi:hypothetical protein
MSLTSRKILPITVALALFMAGCARYEQASVEQRLDRTIKRYEQTLRWGDPVELWTMLKPELRSDHPPPASLSTIRATSVEALSATIFFDEHHASHQIRIEYVLTDRQVVKNMIDEQLWEYDTEIESWFRANPIPDFE